MSMNFEGDVLARGEASSLRTEPGKKNNGNVSVSATFIIEAGQQATDERGRKIDVGGKKLTWYATLTTKDTSRTRMIESLTYTGIPEKVATQIVDKARSGDCGDVPAAAGFGKFVCSLNCKIEEYPERSGKYSTRIKWVNGAGERGRKPRAEMPTLKLDLDGVEDTTTTSAGDTKKSDIPWM